MVEGLKVPKGYRTAELIHEMIAEWFTYVRVLCSPLHSTVLRVLYYYKVLALR